MLPNNEKKYIFVGSTNMNNMEKLLHYTWQHRLLPQHCLQTHDGQPIDIIDPGLPNSNSGPDFFNAKIRIGSVLWVGNVELHDRSSQWYQHKHHLDAHYNNVILHVATIIDEDVTTQHNKTLPQLQLEVPEYIVNNYRELLEEDTYPPCYRIIPHIDTLTQHAWLNALTAERLEQKMQRILHYLNETNGDWERTFFITLARNFGFGTNAEAFEQWALHIPPQTIVKHRDNLLQVEAMFLGQAGLLSEERVDTEQRDDYFCMLQREYRFLSHKFSLQPMEALHWRFLRMRPQNFPHIRLVQMARLYHEERIALSKVLETDDTNQLRKLFTVGVTPYWETHFDFNQAHAPKKKTLQSASLDLLIINTVAPFLFAYGRQHMNEELCERAYTLLEATKPEHNFITRSWDKAGLKAEHAADSQALIQLKRQYCDRKDCLRCRFGARYLRKDMTHN